MDIQTKLDQVDDVYRRDVEFKSRLFDEQVIDFKDCVGPLMIQGIVDDIKRGFRDAPIRKRRNGLYSFTIDSKIRLRGVNFKLLNKKLIQFMEIDTILTRIIKEAIGDESLISVSSIETDNLQFGLFGELTSNPGLVVFLAMLPVLGWGILLPEVFKRCKYKYKKCVPSKIEVTFSKM